MIDIPLRASEPIDPSSPEVADETGRTISPSSSFPRWTLWIWPVIASGLALVLGGWSLTKLSPTIDEWGYVQHGVKYWFGFRQTWLITAGTLPQLFWVQNAAGAIFVQLRHGGLPGGVESDLGRVLSISDQLTVLHLARWTNLLLAGLGTIWMVWALSYRLFGGVAAGVAALFAAIEPNLLAGYIVATGDAPILPICLLMMILYDRQLDQPRWWRLVTLGLLFGVGIACKISMVPTGLLLLLACLMANLLRSLTEPSTIRAKVVRTARQSIRFSGQIAVIVALGFIVSWATCEFRFGPLLDPDSPNLIAYKVAGALGYHGEPAQEWVKGLQAKSVPAPISVLRSQVAHSLGGHPMTFLGVGAEHGPWYYYPYIFAMKANLVVLVVALLSLALRDVRRSSILLALLLVTMLSIRSKVHGGPRYFLINATFACIMCGAGIAWMLSRPSTRRASWVVATALMVGALGLTVRSMPELLPHTNPLWGGDAEGYRYADANYDWGQGLYQSFEAADRLGLTNVVYLRFGNPYYGVPSNRVVISSADAPQMIDQMRGKEVVVSAYLLHHSTRSHPELIPLRKALLAVGPTGRLTVTSFYFDLRSPAQFERFQTELEKAEQEERAIGAHPTEAIRQAKRIMATGSP